MSDREGPGTDDESSGRSGPEPEVSLENHSTSAAQSPRSQSSNSSLAPQRSQFLGDSEPESEPLSAREEREAIDRGWK
jgi:hypothetical protein